MGNGDLEVFFGQVLVGYQRSMYVLAEMACNQVRNSSCELLGAPINLNDICAPLIPLVSLWLGYYYHYS